MSSDTLSTSGRMTRPLTFLFALSGGVVVSNLYWAQPLLGDIGGELAVPASTTGLIMTVVQLGYAAGVFLIVPLGDALQRRRVIPLLMLISAAALTAAALSPTFPMLLVALLVVGVSSVTGQLLTPLAGDLAHPERRGQTVAVVASGLMFGILVSRSVSGLIADATSWRLVFGFAAVLSVVIAVLLNRFVPTLPVPPRVKYSTLLGSVLRAPLEFPALRIMLALGAATMGIFTMFWTGLTFLFTAEPYGFSVTQIGLVSLVSVTGAIAAQHVGRLIDRGWAVQVMGAAGALTLVTMATSIALGHNFVAVLVIVAVSSVGLQSAFVLIQTCAMALAPGSRSRLNTVIVVGNFLGGAAGSALAGVLWDLGGWPVLASAATTIALLALVVWFFGRRRLAVTV